MENKKWYCCPNGLILDLNACSVFWTETKDRLRVFTYIDGEMFCMCQFDEEERLTSFREHLFEVCDRTI